MTKEVKEASLIVSLREYKASEVDELCIETKRLLCLTEEFYDYNIKAHEKSYNKYFGGYTLYTHFTEDLIVSHDGQEYKILKIGVFAQKGKDNQDLIAENYELDNKEFSKFFSSLKWEEPATDPNIIEGEIINDVILELPADTIDVDEFYGLMDAEEEEEKNKSN